MPDKLLPVWRLDAGDKEIHKRLACAKIALRRAALTMWGCKNNDPAWMERAGMLIEDVEKLDEWMEKLRIEAAEKENEKARGE